MEHRPVNPAHKAKVPSEGKPRPKQMPIIVGGGGFSDKHGRQQHQTTLPADSLAVPVSSANSPGIRLNPQARQTKAPERGDVETKKPTHSPKLKSADTPPKKAPVDSSLDASLSARNPSTLKKTHRSAVMFPDDESDRSPPVLTEREKSAAPQPIEWPSGLLHDKELVERRDAGHHLGQASFFRQAQWVMFACALAIGVSMFLFSTKPEAVKVERAPLPPLVELADIDRRDVPLTVKTQGVVSPTLSIPILSEVQGRVVWVSPEFENGGFFQQGQKLVSVERTQYEMDVSRARSGVTAAQQQLLHAEAEMAARQGIDGLETNQLGSGLLQVEQAKARLDAALSELKVAELRLERTEIVAPFSGLVLEKRVGLGQVVAAGGVLGQLYSTDEVEIRLPLTDIQRRSINIPFQGQDVGPKVILSAQLGNDTYRWSGRVTRTESQLNQRNRMLYVVANVKKPFETDPAQPGRPPLSAGTFVDAEISAQTLKNVWVVPRAALRAGDEVWVLNGSDTLKRQSVKVVHKDEAHVYVSEGLDKVNHVIVTPLDVAIDGMSVRLASSSPWLEGRAS